MRKILGIDIGGSKISGIIFDGKKVLEELTIVTPKTLPEFERSLLKLADFLTAQHKISAIGVGMAGLVDAKKGIVVRSPNIPFVHNLNIVKLLSDYSRVPVKVDNDANCFTRAEMLIGQGKSYSNFLCLTLGTGVGGGIVIDKKIYRGTAGTGAELGHIVLNGRFLEKEFQSLRNQKKYGQMGKLFGQAFAGLANIFEPRAFILGGGVTSHAAIFMPPMKSELNKYIFNKHNQPKILISKLKNAGAIGVALLLIK